MIHTELLVLCRTYSQRVWQLPVHVPPKCRRGLIGWRVSPPSIDARMPEPVARLFAGALVRHAIVTFPHAFAAGALHSSPLLRKRGLGHHLLFLHATQVHDALRLFEAGFFDWSMQAQAAFLSPPGLPPPVLTDIHLNLVRNGDRFDELSAAGVTGLFLPGVDGDVAGLFTFSDDLWDSLIREIRDRCEKSGAAWREAPEDEFRELLISRLA